jgi:UDP-glucose 4-epimerase
MTSSKSVLITGAAGFIGSHLTEQCLARGWDVTAIDDFTDYYDPSLKHENIADAAEHPNCTLIEGDLLQLDLVSLLDGVTAVFHLAAQPGVRASWDEFERYVSLNVHATKRLLDAAREAPLDRFVIASSSSVYGDAEALPTNETLTLRPVSPYGVTKAATEHLAYVYWRNYAVPTVWLRYFTVYGPRQRPDMAFNRLISRALGGEPFEVFGDGEQTRDFTFVADAVAGTIAASQAGRCGVGYNLGGGATRSMNSVFDMLATLIDRPVECRYHERQTGDARDTAADIASARDELGYEPSVAFEAGLEAQVKWQRARQFTLEASR